MSCIYIITVCSRCMLLLCWAEPSVDCLLTGEVRILKQWSCCRHLTPATCSYFILHRCCWYSLPGQQQQCQWRLCPSFVFLGGLIGKAWHFSTRFSRCQLPLACVPFYAKTPLCWPQKWCNAAVVVVVVTSDWMFVAICCWTAAMSKRTNNDPLIRPSSPPSHGHGQVYRR